MGVTRGPSRPDFDFFHPAGNTHRFPCARPRSYDRRRASSRPRRPPFYEGKASIYKGKVSMKRAIRPASRSVRSAGRLIDNFRSPRS